MSNVDPRDLVAAILPKSLSQARRDDLADKILDALDEAGHLYADGECTVVEPTDALVPVETVEAYGLTIRLDANGEASEITHPAGLVMTA